MTRCPTSRRVQDFIDGELPEAGAGEFRLHLERCPSCAAEVALYRRAFASLDRLPLSVPPAHLAERILDRVVPSRVRRRWVATVGWSYAASLAACVAVVLGTLSHPGARAFLATASGEVSSRVVSAVVLGLNVLSFAILSFGDGWGVLTSLTGRLVPVVRALTVPFASPLLMVSLAAAAVSCTAVLWWLHPREKRRGARVRPLALGI